MRLASKLLRLIFLTSLSMNAFAAEESILEAPVSAYASNLTFDNFSTPVGGMDNVGGVHSDDGTLAASISANTLTLHGAAGGYWYSTVPVGTCANESAYSGITFTAKASSNVAFQVSVQDKVGCGTTFTNHPVSVNLTTNYQTFTIPFSQFSGLNPSVLWAVVFQNIPSGVTVNVQSIQLTAPATALTFDNYSTPVGGNDNVGGVHSDDGTLGASISANTLTLHGAAGGYWYSTVPVGTCANESAYSGITFTAKASSNVAFQVSVQDKVGCGTTFTNHPVSVNLTTNYQTFTIPFSQFSGLNPSVLWAVVFQNIPSGVTVNVQNLQLMGGSSPVSTQVLTYKNSLSRTGLNSLETKLTQSFVNSSSFGKLYQIPLDANVYAQPLYVANLTMPGRGALNVVFVATTNNTLYAFNADSSDPTPLWMTNFNNASVGGVAFDGILSTPVIDLSRNAIYAVSSSKEGTQYFQRLHAINLQTGAELSGSPVTLQASVPGSGSGSVGGQIAYDSFLQLQRCGLALVNGVIYISSGSHNDAGNYHGWVLAYSSSSLTLLHAFNDTPYGLAGGIWGGAPAADALGNIYVVSGNGDWNGINNFGDSVIQLNASTLNVNGYFAPPNQDFLNRNDLDLGSGAVALIPTITTPSGALDLMTIAGKEGTLYLLDQRNPSGGQPNGSTSVPYDTFVTATTGENFGAPAVWNGNVYIHGSNDVLRSYGVALQSTGKYKLVATGASSLTMGARGANPVVSSNGNKDPIVWETVGCCINGGLIAYNANNISNILYDSRQNPADFLSGYIKFGVPTVVNGKVYVGGSSYFAVFGDKTASALIKNKYDQK